MKNSISGAIFLFLFLLSSNVIALEKPGEELKEVGVSPKLGTQLDLKLIFQNSEAATVSLNDYVAENQPLILVPAYFRCPGLCGLVHNGVKELLNKLELRLNKDYKVVTFSFNPEEGPELAKGKEEGFRKTLSLAEDSRLGWNFLVGKSESINTLTKDLGFTYKKDKGEYAHSSAIYIVTPAGKISQYFTGVQYDPFDVRLALIEASKGKIGSALDRVLLYCYRFDPTKGKYIWAAFGIMRAGGALTLVLLAWLLISLWKKERQSLEKSKL